MLYKSVDAKVPVAAGDNNNTFPAAIVTVTSVVPVPPPAGTVRNKVVS